MLKAIVRAMLLAVLVMAPAASACECITIGGETDPSTWKPGLTRLYSAVFAGYVTAVQPIAIPLHDPNTFRPMVLVTFRVTTVWKGPHEPVLWLITGNGGGDCGYVFEIGTEYVVFAEEFDGQDRRELGLDRGTLTTGICSLTAPTADAEKLVAYLDRTSNEWKPRFRALHDASPNTSLQPTRQLRLGLPRSKVEDSALGRAPDPIDGPG